MNQALELRWGDIAFGDRPVVKVRRQTRRGVINDPKTEAGTRDVPLSPGLSRPRRTSGMNWVTFHSLRHTTASLLFAHGKNLKQVQHWLGHASPQLTQNTYLHLMDDGLGDADFLDELTSGDPGQSEVAGGIRSASVA
jgi:integrase